MPKNSQTHPNSRIITIYRTTNALVRAQGGNGNQNNAVQDYLSNSHVSVGSYFEKGSTVVASGLSSKEKDIIMPHLVDADPDDRDFREKVTNFFIALDTTVPFGTGVELEIGLEEDNDRMVGKDNMPINLMDFVRWRVAKGHPFMASSKEEADGNSNKQFYIYDPVEKKKRNSNARQEKDTAMEIYMNIKSDEKKVDGMLLLLGVEPRGFSGETALEEKIEELRKLADKSPKLFTDIYQSGSLETKYLVQQLVNTKILEQVGIKFRDASSKKIIGNNLDEVIMWFEDEVENSEDIIAYKARLQEALKVPYVKSRRTILN